MARYKKPTEPKSDALIEAETAAREALRSFFRKDFGKQAELARTSGIPASNLCRMSTSDTYPVSLETALKIEIATQGELTTELLCPSGAELLQKLFLTRATRMDQ